MRDFRSYILQMDGQIMTDLGLNLLPSLLALYCPYGMLQHWMLWVKTGRSRPPSSILQTLQSKW